MSARQRGQEVQIRFSIDGVPQTGSWLKIMDWTLTPRIDISEDPFLGETEDDLDIQYHGVDFKFSVQNKDAKTLEFFHDLISREHDRLTPARITMTVLHLYRESDAEDKIQVYPNALIKVDEHAFGSRKDRTKTSFSGKAKRADLLAA